MIIKLHKKNVEIDDEMVPVIKELNRLGIKTTSCCSGHNGGCEAQIAFDAKDVNVLLSKGMVSINWERKKP